MHSNPRSNDGNSLAKLFNDYILIDGKPLSATQHGVKTMDIQIADSENAAECHGTMVECIHHLRHARVMEIDKEGRAVGRLLPKDNDDKKVTFQENADQEPGIFDLDLTQVQLTQLFCAMIGMGDMHVENLVYTRKNLNGPNDPNDPFQVAMIDADNAMDFHMMNISTYKGSGFMKNYYSSDVLARFSMEESKKRSLSKNI